MLREIHRASRARLGGVATSERGAALVMVLIALVGLTAMAAAGIAITGTEVRVSENVDSSTRAFYAADAGLRAYLGSSADGSTGATYTIDGMTVTVTSDTMAALASGRVLYEITSSAALSVGAAGSQASRTVRTLAVYSDGEITVPASFTAPAGLLKNGSTGTISGQDWATPGNPKCPNSPKSDIAGVKVPPSGYTQAGGGTLVPTGDPPVDDSQSATDILQDIGIDWESVTSGGLIAPDYTIPPDTWPNFASLPADEWPVIYVDGNSSVSPSNSGRGTLIVTGNLEMNGTFTWDGAILVGGYITSNGYQIVQGATLSGLNLLLGESVPSTDIGNGNKVFKYNSCYLKQATEAAFGGLAAVPGTWSEEI